MRAMITVEGYEIEMGRHGDEGRLHGGNVAPCVENNCVHLGPIRTKRS
jgi:hypothetical protein